MNVTGIIAEYNPFHNGHAYHLKEARRLTNADYLVVVMSGNFVQRGEPAIIHKYARARIALAEGADLVLELPFCYATGSAEFFAGGSIFLLNSLGCVDHLCFGSESSDLTALMDAALILKEEPAPYQESLRQFLKAGDSFPLARSKALIRCGHASAASVLSEPNNTLGVEYLKAILQQKSRISPVTIHRIGSGYHEKELSGTFCSATALRSAFTESLQDDGNSALFPDTAARMMPEGSSSVLREAWNQTFPVVPKDLSVILHYRLLMASSREELSRCFDIPPDLARRIFRLRSSFTDFDSFAELVKTRNMTSLTVRRALLHILLDLPSSEIPGNRSCPYAKVLGFRKEAAPLLKEIKEKGHLPLILKPADAPDILHSFYSSDEITQDLSLAMFERDILASRIYNSLVAARYRTQLPDDYRQKLILM